MKLVPKYKHAGTNKNRVKGTSYYENTNYLSKYETNN